MKLLSPAQYGLVHPMKGADLHDALYDWVWNLSDYRDLLMVRENFGQGESVKWTISSERKDPQR
ncbi:MAG: hypothetical protein ACTHN5_17345 [Phycisphaerae bacterium]